MPTVTIDGQEITVEPGTSIVQAAKQLAVDVPVFCYHPGLSVPANCRMCLVDVEKAPKPLPGCYTECRDGMVIHTKSEKAQDAQRSVLEFILLNHPVDCPICDQAGECVLQEHYVTHSAQPSRLFHQKVAKPKAVPLGPRVVLDSERCILCTRCIRFCDEVAGRNELILEDRGETVEINTFPGRQLENPYSLNTVDICPVGALTDRKFRFQRRVWFLERHDSVCSGCARGCSMRLDSYQDKTERVVPRYNPDVNNHWMCDEGRDLMVERTRQPGVDAMLRGEVTDDFDALLALVASWLRPVEAEEALEADTLDEGEDEPGPGRVVFALSASLTNEEVFAWAKLAEAIQARVVLTRRTAWQGDDVLKVADRDCNDTGAQAILHVVRPKFGGPETLSEALDHAEVLLAVDHDAAFSQEALEAIGKVDKTVVLTDIQSELAGAASVVIPMPQLHQRDGTITNSKGWVQRTGAPLRAPPPNKAVAPLAAAIGLAGRLGVDIGLQPSDGAVDVMTALATQVSAFHDMSHAYVGDLGAELTRGGPRTEKPARVEGTPEWEPDRVHPTHDRHYAIQRGN